MDHDRYINSVKNKESGSLAAIQIVRNRTFVSKEIKLVGLNNNKPGKDFQVNEDSERAPLGKSRKPCKILRGENCSAKRAKLTREQTRKRE